MDSPRPAKPEVSRKSRPTDNSAFASVECDSEIEFQGQSGAESSLSTTVPQTRSSVPAGKPHPNVAVWLARIWLVIRVAFFVELGLVLVLLPWTRGWTENTFLVAYPGVRMLLQNNFVRGVISGLGFLDIGCGIWEAIRYKETLHIPAS